jgi:hypothetical protein
VVDHGLLLGTELVGSIDVEGALLGAASAWLQPRNGYLERNSVRPTSKALKNLAGTELGSIDAQGALLGGAELGRNESDHRKVQTRAVPHQPTLKIA